MADLRRQVESANLLFTEMPQDAVQVMCQIQVEVGRRFVSVNEDAEVWRAFALKRTSVRHKIQELERMPDADQVSSRADLAREQITVAERQADQIQLRQADTSLDLALAAVEQGRQWLVARGEILGALDVAYQELHRACAPFAGLKTLRKVLASAYGAKEVAAGKLKALIKTYDTTLAATKTPEYAQSTVALLLRTAEQLKRDIAGTRDDRVREKLNGSLDAVEDLSDEIQLAVGSFVDQWEKISVTDAPNPYYGEQDAYDLANLPEPLATLYNPSERYVHVDGDEYINGAKSAAASKVRERLISKMKSDSEMEQEVRDQKEVGIKETVLRSLGASLKEKVVGEAMDRWYRSEGVRILNEADQTAAAKAWAKGQYYDVEIPELVMEQINLAATGRLNELKTTAFPQEDYDRAVGAEVTARVLKEVSLRKGRFLEDNQMAEGDYWVELGKMGEKSGHGRCFTCAGIAVKSLVMNPAFDALTIESVGAVNYDHHFVLVGRKGGAVGSKTPPGPTSDVLVVDIWQGNLGADPPVRKWKDFTYKGETELRVFSVMKPEDREELRGRFSG